MLLAFLLSVLPGHLWLNVNCDWCAPSHQYMFSSMFFAFRMLKAALRLQNLAKPQPPSKTPKNLPTKLLHPRMMRWPQLGRPASALRKKMTRMLRGWARVPSVQLKMKQVQNKLLPH